MDGMGNPVFGLVSSFMTSVCCDFLSILAEAKIAHGEVWRLASASRRFFKVLTCSLLRSTYPWKDQWDMKIVSFFS